MMIRPQDRLQQMNRPESANLFVKNLAGTIGEDRLREMFAPFGSITSAKVARSESGESKRYGFVCFGTDADAARKAMFYMNGRLIAGKPIYVNVAQKKEQRTKLLAAQFSKSQDTPDERDEPKVSGLVGDDQVML
ncbi:hypothetical protein RP20_CCG022736 [Aedes albopictus]|nr:hypothetical protein RP20_CCG022736 [Aedes albopictus]